MISTYGASLAGKSALSDDPVWHLEWSEDLQLFREYGLNVLQQAKVYFLDHLVDDYADTLHDAVQEKAEAIGVPAMAVLGEVKLPSNVSWVEFDCRALAIARFE